MPARRSGAPAARRCAPRGCGAHHSRPPRHQAPDGRQLRLLNVVDEFTREALAIECERTIDADETVATLAAVAAKRGVVPENLRADNGPELTARVLREWCEQGSTATAYIEPGSPWQNAWVESFNARVRDELLDLEEFLTLAEAQVLAADYRDDYNANHHHSALAMMAPKQQPDQSTPNSQLGWTDEWGPVTMPDTNNGPLPYVARRLVTRTRTVTAVRRRRSPLCQARVRRSAGRFYCV